MAADLKPQILFAGGGHTHLAALGALAQRVRGRARLVLLSESSQLLYSGMMPGWLAGRYALHDCAIDLRELAQRAGVEWVTDTLVDIDFQARQAVGAQGTRYGWDLLSLNVGTAVDPGVIRNAALTVLPVKPFGHFVQRWQEWLARAPEFKEWELKSTPNQFFTWARSDVPYNLLAAAPMPNAPPVMAATLP